MNQMTGSRRLFKTRATRRDLAIAAAAVTSAFMPAHWVNATVATASPSSDVTVETSGPFSVGGTSAEASGLNANTFPAFSVIDFAGFSFGGGVSGFNTATLSLVEFTSTSAATKTNAGTVNFYLSQDTTTALNSGTLVADFSAGGVGGLPATTLAPHSITPIAAVKFNNVNNTRDTFALTFTPSEQAYIVSEINLQRPVRIIETVTNNTMAARYDTTFAGSVATLSIDATVSSASRSILWNGPGTTWNSTDNNFLNTATAASTSFQTLDAVTFSNTGIGAVTIDPAGVAPGSTIVANSTGTYTFVGGAINGGTVNKTGTGALVMANGSNTYYGATTIAAGTLLAGITNAFSPNSAMTVPKGGVLDLNGFSTTVTTAALAGGSILLNGGTFTVANLSATTTSASFQTSSITGTGAITIPTSGTTAGISHNSGTFTTTDLEIGAKLAGSGKIVFTGTGSVAIDGDNSGYTGNIQWSGITIIAGGSTAFGGNSMFFNGGTMTASTALTGTNALNNGVSVGGSINFAGTNPIELGGSGTISVFNGGSQSIGVFNTTTISELIADPSNGVTSFSKFGTGTLIISNNGNYNSGTVGVTGGTLVVSATGALSSIVSANVNAGSGAGTFLLQNSSALPTNLPFNAILGTKSFAGAIAVDGLGSGATVPLGTFTVSGPNASTGTVTFAAANANDTLQIGTLNVSIGSTTLSGASLVKTGSGLLQITGPQSYVAGSSLAINNGTVELDTDAASGGPGKLPITIASTGSLYATVGQNILSLNSAGTANFSAGTTAIGSATGTGTVLTGSGATVSVSSGFTQGGIVSAGTINILGGSANSLGTVNGAGKLNITAANSSATYIRQTALSVGSLSTVTITHDDVATTGGTPTHTSSVTSLSLASTGTLDLTNNGIVVTDTTQFGAIQSSLATAYTSGWASPGITSSTAAAHTADHGVGYALASAIGSTSFNGITFADAVIARYTLLGDTNLKGGVDLGDYTKVITNLGKTGTVWSDGNFDYSGTVGLGDYTKVILALGRTDATALNDTTLNATAGPSAKQVRASSSALTLKAAAAAIPAATATDVHLVVNTASGLVTLISAVSGSQAIITAYTVKSPSGSLVKFKNSGSKYLGSAFQNNPGVFYSSSNGNTYNNWTGIKNTSTIIGEGFGNNYIATNDTTWTNYTLSSGGYALGAMFKTLSAGGVQDLSFQWDDKALNTFTSVVDYVGGTVPEPTSVSLIAMGAVGLLGRRRRRSLSK